MARFKSIISMILDEWFGTEMDYVLQENIVGMLEFLNASAETCRV